MQNNDVQRHEIPPSPTKDAGAKGCCGSELRLSTFNYEYDHAVALASVEPALPEDTHHARLCSKNSHVKARNHSTQQAYMERGHSDITENACSTATKKTACIQKTTSANLYYTTR